MRWRGCLRARRIGCGGISFRSESQSSVLLERLANMIAADPQSAIRNPHSDKLAESLAAMSPKLSLFLPVYNEEGNLERLQTKITEAMATLGQSYEVIYVDDGSSDRSLELLKRFAA